MNDVTRNDWESERRDALSREALAWLTRVGLGEATQEDLAALRRWRDTSPEHAAALAQAGRLWRGLEGPVAVLARSGAMPVGAQRAGGRFSRRGFLAAGMAATAAAAGGVMMVKPPLQLWPSLAEIGADVRTATGEQRQLTIAEAVSVELNTRTSIDVRTANGEPTIALIAGETTIAVTRASRPIVVTAADGRISAHRATFNVRRDGTAVCLTCLAGEVTVERHARTLTLGPTQQVSYDSGSMGTVVTADPEIVAGWRDGMLVFRNTPLAQVIDEVNRYRPGRIVLVDSGLAQQLVTARFELSRLDTVMGQISHVFKVPVKSLPGGLVLVG